LLRGPASHAGQRLPRKSVEDMRMNMKKTVGAMVAGFVLQMGGLFLIHSVWLMQDYMDTASVWRTQEEEQSRMWAMIAGVLLYVIAAVLIYVRGVEMKPWIGQGIRFGILLAFIGTVYNSLALYAVLPIPHMLAVKWMIGEGLLAIFLGLLIAVIVQPKTASA
jgi:hypothetical protein